jgi:hypothetical protein
MRRLLIPAVVIVMAFVAGVAVAGRPTTVANDVSFDDMQVVESTTTTSMPFPDTAAP